MKGGFVMPFAKENSLREHIGQDDISGFLAEGTEIKGEIRFKDILRIDGKVGGTIVSEGELVIGETGEVDAEVRVGTLSVSGRLTGKVHATEKVEIHAKGRVVGDMNLASPNLVIHEGGVFEGTIEMGSKGEGHADNLDAESTLPNVEPFRRS
jgi:cytoskeletal protein CcmA (bactofilin family)